MVVLETRLPNLLYRGKVRDTYALGKDLLLMVATDRISAFDVVLPTGIPQKGLVLCHLSAFWFKKTAHIVPNHFIALASQAANVPSLRGISQLASLPGDIAQRSMVVRRARRIDIECVVRGYLAGSAWAEYRKSGTAFGIPLPKGLLEGSKLERPIFTPTTKAETGHDQSLTMQQVVEMVGEPLARELEEKSIALYQYAHDYALTRGIILADTKMEFGFIDGKLHLIDELFTPDSSRFWDASLYRPGQSQPNFDKQYVRDWLTQSGWNKEPPAPELPEEVVHKTTQRYLEAYHRLTGEKLNLQGS